MDHPSFSDQDADALFTEAPFADERNRYLHHCATLGARPEVLRVKRIDALFDIEREINGLVASERLQRRQQESRPIVHALEEWLRAERTKLSRSSPVTEPIDYMLKRWDGFTSFLGDGRICLTNNAAERALRGFALGRKAWLFAGSDRGADRAAFMATLIMSAKLNDIDPQAWLADVLARIADTPVTKLEQLLPWSWSPSTGRAG